MKNIRVAVVGLPRMASDVLRRSMKRQPNMEVVVEHPTYEDLRILLRRIRPDVLVLGLSAVELPDACESAIRANPDVSVLGLSRDTRWAVRYELRPVPVPLETASLDGLLGEIRAIARSSSS